MGYGLSKLVALGSVSRVRSVKAGARGHRAVAESPLKSETAMKMYIMNTRANKKSLEYLWIITQRRIL